MEKVKENQRDPRIWVAVFAFSGVVFATLGSLAGTVIGVWAKSQGWI
jgi:ABC-type lipoprotein release transport system permease subunit